jgi:AraC-like DNA-binding protein
VVYNLSALFLEIDRRLDADLRLSLHSLAQALGVERHTLERAVRVTKGTTFRTYAQQKRLHKAIELLNRAAGLDRRQIAYRVGYRSESAFSRFIKSATGSTPSDIMRATDDEDPRP